MRCCASRALGRVRTATPDDEDDDDDADDEEEDEEEDDKCKDGPSATEVAELSAVRSRAKSVFFLISARSAAGVKIRT